MKIENFDPNKNYNEIDLSCDIVEDDDSFGGPIRTISADIRPNGTLTIQKNFKPAQAEEDYSGYNQIDMECDVCEDDDDDFIIKCKPSDNKIDKSEILDFGDDEDDYFIASEKHLREKDLCDYDYDDFADEIKFKAKELVAEDMLEEKKKISQGEVEADYWKQLSKKHSKTNVKGAYNTHFHFAGDPEREAELFNHDIQAALPHSSIEASENNLMNAGEANTIASGEVSSTGDVEAGIGESVKANKTSHYKQLYEDLLLITGFEVTPVKSDLYALKDTFNLIPEKECTKDELKAFLAPYIEDYFMCPLRQKTGQDFKTCDEVCNWYTPEKEKEYPGCKDDIDYCDLFANHWEEIC